MQYLDRLGWPVVRYKGRYILNFFRLLIHTKKIKLGKFKYNPTIILDPNSCQCECRRRDNESI